MEGPSLHGYCQRKVKQNESQVCQSSISINGMKAVFCQGPLKTIHSLHSSAMGPYTVQYFDILSRTLLKWALLASGIVTLSISPQLHGPLEQPNALTSLALALARLASINQRQQ